MKLKDSQIRRIAQSLGSQETADWQELLDSDSVLEKLEGLVVLIGVESLIDSLSWALNNDKGQEIVDSIIMLHYSFASDQRPDWDVPVK